MFAVTNIDISILCIIYSRTTLFVYSREYGIRFNVRNLDSKACFKKFDFVILMVDNMSENENMGSKSVLI